MDESVLTLVREWMTRARHDLDAAKVLAASDKTLLDTAIYHCQQAAEKSVKAWLQLKDEPFPKTHDIEELVEQASKLNADFQELSKAATILTPYVSAFRYPSGADESMPTRQEFDEALNLAQSIYDFVFKLLPAGGRPKGEETE